MARIFYHTDTGNIYGVHGGPFDGDLPSGVDFIDVAEAPDAIPWPVPVGATEGSEKTSRVEAGALVAVAMPPGRVDYVTVLERLSDVDAEDVTTFVAGLPAKTRERLRHRGIPSDNQTVRNWLSGRGYDPDVVLAR